MFTRATSALAAIAAFALAAGAPALAAPGGEAGKPSGPGRPADGGTTTSFIVQFTPGADRAAEVSKAKSLGMEVTHVYDAVFSGMAVRANQGQATALQQNPNVAVVEADGVATTQATQSPTPSWGLDRIDQPSRPLDNAYSYGTDGSGVTAYIIDTGINATHSDFTGRVSTTSFDAFGGTGADCNGHGTHVAGTVGGSRYGVAKGVQLVAVRVLDCSGSGSWSGVIAGLNWVAAHHLPGVPAVANMSLGGPASSSVDAAVQAVINDGVSVAVAAGNSNRDACQFSPARVSAALTVGATTSSDARASYSNYGRCLDMFAPGSAITSAWFGSTSATNTISGTSMASPHVAGAAARILQANNALTPAAVASSLITVASTNRVSSAGKNSANRLLFANPLS